MQKNYYSLGLMSGTSMDGVDASIIKSDGELAAKIIDEMYFEYDTSIKYQLKSMIGAIISKKLIRKKKKDFSDLEKKITLFHAKVSEKIIKRNKQINLDLIGFHGQTILHKPQEGYSIQMGDPNLLSKILKKKVVAQFRQNDLKNGGQGAPLAPIYHFLIVNNIRVQFPLAIINIGGISNITYFNRKKNFLSFDIGPGNCLIDKWIYTHTKYLYDHNGKFAQKGNVRKNLLETWLDNKIFHINKPKSFDIKDFDIRNKLSELNLEDGAATLSMMTVNLISESINNLEDYPTQVLICGGGRKNHFIFNNLKLNINCPVNKIDDFNFNGDFIESQAFAYLAIRSFLKKNLTYPSTTGVKAPCLGGKLFNKS